MTLLPVDRTAAINKFEIRRRGGAGNVPVALLTLPNGAQQTVTSVLQQLPRCNHFTSTRREVLAAFFFRMEKPFKKRREERRYFHNAHKFMLSVGNDNRESLI